MNRIDEPLIAGVDEAGRGPLAGAVVAAAVILGPGCHISGLTDSKKLKQEQRNLLDRAIRRQSKAWAIARVEHNEIDRINILQASLLAMKKAIRALSVRPDLVLVDGMYCPEGIDCQAQAIIKGDSKIPEISAASIIAKVSRDEEMRALDARYPGYGLAQNKGYPTKAHIAALHKQGICAIHRKSFAPVKDILKKYDQN